MAKIYVGSAIPDYPCLHGHQFAIFSSAVFIVHLAWNPLMPPVHHLFPLVSQLHRSAGLPGKQSNIGLDCQVFLAPKSSSHQSASNPRFAFGYP